MDGNITSLENITKNPNGDDKYKQTVTDLTPMTEYCYTIQTVNNDIYSEEQDPPCKVIQTDTAGKLKCNCNSYIIVNKNRLQVLNVNYTF